MTPFFQSLITHLWESTIFGTVCFLLILGFSRTSSFSRHLLAWASIIKFVIPFSTLAFLSEGIRAFLAHPNVAGTELAPTLGLFTQTLQIDTWIELPGPEAAVTTGLPWEMLLGTVWLAGFLALSTIWIRQYRRAGRSISEGCAEVGPEWQHLAEDIWERSLRSMPRLLVCRDENLPAGVFGLFRPAVIIPTSFQTGFEPDEREAFLRHEFQHLYKHDNTWLLVQKLIRNLFWIHPLVWWFDRQISAEREIMRDAEVIQKTENAKSYLNCLMKASTIQLPRSYATSVGIEGSPFARRIKAILKERTSRVFEVIAAVGSVTAVLALTVFLSTALAPSALLAGEDAIDDDRRLENQEGHFRELEMKLSQQTAQLETYAAQLEQQQKNGISPTEQERAQLHELRRTVDQTSEQLSDEAAQIRERQMSDRDFEAQMKEINHALARDDLQPEQREQLMTQMKRLEINAAQDRDRYRDDPYRPKLSDSEKKLIREVRKLARTDKEAALDLVLETITEDSSAALEFTAANLLTSLEEPEKAIVFYQVALDKDPNFRAAAKNLGILQAKRGDYDGAKTNLLKAISLGAEDDGAMYGLLGLCYLKGGDAITAEHFYRAAIDRQPETRDWREGLAKSLSMQGKQS